MAFKNSSDLPENEDTEYSTSVIFENDTEKLIEFSKFHSYKRRWYILVVYSLAAFLQGYLWNMWGPIFHSMVRYLDWGPAQLSLMPFYGALALFLFSLPSAVFLKRFSLRVLMLTMTFVTLIGCAIRCIHFSSSKTTTIMINLSALINSVPGVVTFFLPSFISSRWFPSQEHYLATAVGVSSNSFGVAFAYLFGPQFVRQTNIELTDMIDQYYRYTYFQATFALLLFLMVVIYYPSSPPTPPSHSMLTLRYPFWQGCWLLLKSSNFWLASAPAYLIFATVGIWITILPLDLASENISQVTSDQIGFYGALLGSLMGVLTGKIGDWTGDLKALLLSLTCLTLISLGWLLLVIHHIIEYSVTQVFIAGVSASTFSLALLPVSFELCNEICFPIDESAVVSVVGMIIASMNILFLSILFLPSVGTAWMDYFLLVSCLISLPILLWIKPVYKRRHDDHSVED